MGKFGMNESGQAESVFRLMIDSVIGLAILLIIISSIGLFQDYAVKQSKADLTTLIKNATNTPDGQILASRELNFQKGFGVDSFDAQDWTGVAEKCFSFESQLASISVSSDGKRAEFSNNMNIKVYAKCSPAESCDPLNPGAQCCFRCVVSLGTKIQ